MDMLLAGVRIVYCSSHHVHILANVSNLWNLSASLFLRVHPKRNSRKRSLLALVLSLVPHHTPPEMDIQGPIKLEMKTQGYVSPSSPHIFALSGTHIFCDLRSCCSYVSLVYGREEITCDHRNFRRASANHFYMKNEILQLQFPLPCK